MDEAIKKLRRNQGEWEAKAIEYRKEMFDAIAKNNIARREEYRQLYRLAVENVSGLEYAVAILKTT